MSEMVFVYGTLKSGHRASWMMSSHGEKVCDATTVGTLVDLGAFPGLLLKGDNDVHGELWMVDRAALRVLDNYEGEGTLYQRLKVDVTKEDGTVVQDVWAYEYLAGTRGVRYYSEIKSGCWGSNVGQMC